MQDKESSMDNLEKESVDNSCDINADANTVSEDAVNTDNISEVSDAYESDDILKEFEDDLGAEETEGNDKKTTEDKASKLSSFLKNKKDKKDKKDIQIDEINDKLKRTMAEFDNFRKRSEKEKAQMYDIGARAILEKILPVIDNFERGLGTLTEEEKTGAFAQGIEKIYKQLVSSLNEAGLKSIEAIGNEFDPNFHNAVMHAEDPELGENIVAEEFLKGYIYRDTVVRHSMVKVVN